MTEAEFARIKSHVQQWDSTCFDVRRAFEDRDALIAEVERLRAMLVRAEAWICTQPDHAAMSAAIREIL